MASDQCLVASGGKSRFSLVIPEGSSEVASFAASELQRYLEQMTGAQLPLVDEEYRGPVIVVGDGEPEPGWQLAPDRNTVTVLANRIMVGGGGRQGVLRATYRLLELAGCRFILPGPEGEYVPDTPVLSLPIGETEENPEFLLRGLWEDTHHVHFDRPAERKRHLDSERAWLDWMGKRGLNQFLSARTPEVCCELAGDMRSRGIAHEVGGHIIPTLLPRELFEQHPEYFRADKQGNRTPTGNFCVSSPEALGLVSKAACDHVRHFPLANILHLWGEDVMGGSWCFCPDCAALSPSEQYLRVVNAVARELDNQQLALAVDYLAYHDTLKLDFSSVPSSRTLLAYAPRERSYGESLAGECGEPNQGYVQALEGLLPSFEGRACLLEYYGDAILYGSQAIPLTSVIVEDAEVYRRMAITGLYCLIFGEYSSIAYGLNLYAFSRCLWKVSSAPEELVNDYVSGLFGEPSEQLEAFYFGLERAMAGVARHHDIKVPRFASLEEGQQLLTELVESRQLLQEALELVADFGSKPPQRGSLRLAAELNAVKFTELLLHGVYHHTKALVMKAELKLEEDPAAQGTLRTRALAELQDAVRQHSQATHLMTQAPLSQKGLWGLHGIPDAERRVLQALEGEVRELVPELGDS